MSEKRIAETTPCPHCGRTDRHSHRVMMPALAPERPLYPDQPGYVPKETTVRHVTAWPDTVRRMTNHDVEMFEQGFAAYADGVPHDHVPAYPDIEDRRWWLKGWYASRNANECINGHR